MESQCCEETWLMLLLGDSSFPGGSLANSQGMESAIHHGVLCNGDFATLHKFMVMSLEQVVHSSLPFVRTAHSLGVAKPDYEHNPQDPTLHTLYSSLINLDKYCHAFLSNEVSRRASINQGKCFLRVAQHAFSTVQMYITAIQQPYQEASSTYSQSQHLHTHFAPIFGFVCKYLGISMEMCDRLYSKIYLRDLISAAVRLNLIGPLDGVLLQVEIFPVLDNLLQQTLYPSQETDERSCANSCYEGSADIVCVQKGSAAPTVEAAPIILDGRCAAIQFYNRIKPVQTAPVVDLLQSRHDMLYSRLFNS